MVDEYVKAINDLAKKVSEEFDIEFEKARELVYDEITKRIIKELKLRIPE